MRVALVAVLLLLASSLSACAPSEITLRDPRTGQTAQCGGDAASRWNREMTDTCARGYEAAGWQRLSQE